MGFSWKEFATKGEAIYQKKIKKKLLPNIKGKFAAIDVFSQDYFVGDTLMEAFQKAKQKYPGHKFHFVKIGYPAAVSFKHRTQP